MQSNVGHKWPHPVGNWGIGLPINEHNVYECDLEFRDVEWWINHCKWKKWWNGRFAHEMRQVATAQGFPVSGHDSPADLGCDDPLYSEYDDAMRATRGPLGVVSLAELLDEPTFEEWAEARS
jgi:hypothetical protein